MGVHYVRQTRGEGNNVGACDDGDGCWAVGLWGCGVVGVVGRLRAWVHRFHLERNYLYRAGNSEETMFSVQQTYQHLIINAAI